MNLQNKILIFGANKLHCLKKTRDYIACQKSRNGACQGGRLGVFCLSQSTAVVVGPRLSQIVK